MLVHYQMEFNKAFASLCSHIDNFKHKIEEYNGHKVKSFRTNTTTAEAHNVLKSFNSDIELDTNNIVELLYKGFVKIYDEYVQDDDTFYQDTSNYPIFTFMEYTISERFHIRNTVFTDQEKNTVKTMFETIFKCI